ncbi:MAG: TRAM domain-containing protein [Candidatus Omnitrophota bacterium]
MVYVRGKDLRPGDFARVKITGVTEYDLEGDAI